MTTPITATKLYIPRPRPHVVKRPRLIARLNDSLQRKLTLISAAAGCGKTTLAGEGLAGCGRAAAWLSLDEGDNDAARFLSCLVASLRTVHARIGEGMLGMLQSGHTPPVRSVIASLINDYDRLLTRSLRIAAWATRAIPPISMPVC